MVNTFVCEDVRLFSELNVFEVCTVRERDYETYVGCILPLRSSLNRRLRCRAVADVGRLCMSHQKACFISKIC